MLFESDAGKFPSLNVPGSSTLLSMSVSGFLEELGAVSEDFAASMSIPSDWPTSGEDCPASRSGTIPLQGKGGVLGISTWVFRPPVMRRSGTIVESISGEPVLRILLASFNFDRFMDALKTPGPMVAAPEVGFLTRMLPLRM
uniref:Uncharacterized protein n=1 Tax=Opuntia streptacantha TaxID=393608 RepID=A0A7C9DRP7_OPUST